MMPPDQDAEREAFVLEWNGIVAATVRFGVGMAVLIGAGLAMVALGSLIRGAGL